MQEQIGRYEIRREIGRGGMATVYLAYDPRFKRQVAIKVLPRQFTHDPKYLARFEQEAQTIGALEHPAIVPVHDFGEYNDAPYLVMRYMAGGSLRDRLKGQPLPLEAIAPTLQRLAPALDNAHELGIIHRDLKPANILFDEEGRSYLGDFGIARLAESSHTMTMIGTPAYMSPEQVESKRQLDGRSDLYALGVMLYELLSGEKPFEADTPTGQMLMHILEPVPDITQVNPDLPAGTQQVIEKAMAKDPDDRYQSAAELTTAVAGLVDQPDGPVVSEELADVEPEIEMAETPPEEVSDETPPELERVEPEVAQEELEPLPVADEKIPESAPPISRGEDVSHPADSTAPSNGLPKWLWLVGGLAVLVVGILVIRFIWPGIFGGGSGGSQPGIETSEPQVRSKDGMTMVYVPAGTFLMGSEDGDKNERPPHEVSLNAFWIDQTEVTNDQFARFVADTGHVTLAEELGNSDILLGTNWMYTQGANWRQPFGPDSHLVGLENHPVVHVSWEDAMAYCAWAGGELPTEAQWEYAARGPESLIYPWGNGFDGDIVNFCDKNCPFDWANQGIDDGYAFTSPVNAYPAGVSHAGAMDMAGNAWEWVSDWYQNDYYDSSPVDNPSGPDGGDQKVLRGGSWSHDEYGLRGAYRRSDNSQFRNGLVGFRCVTAPSANQASAAEVEAPPALGKAPPIRPPNNEEITNAEGNQEVPFFDASLGDKWARPTDGMPMRFMPAGTFPMGSELGDKDESPVHEVTLDAFWIDETEVTHGQYGRCVAEGRCNPSFDVVDAALNGDDHPVVGVSWYDAGSYCTWAGARLPSEAQWEYAARGPQGRKYPWGNESPVCEIAQFGGCDGDTVPTASLPGGAAWGGTLEMAGNVWEWVNDWYLDSYYHNSPPNNPQGPQNGSSKVVRGGSWGNDILYLRGATRDAFIPRNKYIYVGFRCALSSGG